MLQLKHYNPNARVSRVSALQMLYIMKYNRTKLNSATRFYGLTTEPTIMIED